MKRFTERYGRALSAQTPAWEQVKLPARGPKRKRLGAVSLIGLLSVGLARGTLAQTSTSALPTKVVAALDLTQVDLGDQAPAITEWLGIPATTTVVGVEVFDSGSVDVLESLFAADYPPNILLGFLESVGPDDSVVLIRSGDQDACLAILRPTDDENPDGPVLLRTDSVPSPPTDPSQPPSPPPPPPPPGQPVENHPTPSFNDFLAALRNLILAQRDGVVPPPPPHQPDPGDDGPLPGEW